MYVLNKSFNNIIFVKSTKIELLKAQNGRFGSRKTGLKEDRIKFENGKI